MLRAGRSSPPASRYLLAASPSRGRGFGRTGRQEVSGHPVLHHRRAPVAGPAAATAQLPALPEAVTSFGGAILDGYVYIYGGNTGNAHSYSKHGQAKVLRRLPLKGGAWEAVAEGPGLQGLALVAHGGKLYRIGGFTAMNEEGQEHDLQSQNSFASFDPATKKWTDLPALPEARSSHDAAVVGNVIYVVGGWKLGGEEDQKWHSTAWQFDLSAEKPEWKPLPAPSFHRRAVALAEHQGKLYVIGGMQEQGGPTTRVDIFDPKSNSWSQGPSLVGEEGMTGFGASAFAAGGRPLTQPRSRGTCSGCRLTAESGKSLPKLRRPASFTACSPSMTIAW